MRKRASIWCRLGVAAGLAVSLCAGAAGRELASAPEVRLIGFSPDGRYFAYESFQNDDLSDEVFAAIDVIDRQTGRSAAGFPFGFLGVSKNGAFPLRVGGHDIAADASLDGPARLAALRAAIAAAAAPRLGALAIAERGRRLAGFPITDRSADPAGPRFVLAPTLPGPVPDLQPLYRVSARVEPDDRSACVSDGRPRDHTIVLRIEAHAPDGSDPEQRTVAGAATVQTAWPAGDNECAGTIRVTDIVEAPGGSDEARYVAVVMLGIAWGAHAEGARHFAAFVKLP